MEDAPFDVMASYCPTGTTGLVYLSLKGGKHEWEPELVDFTLHYGSV